MSTEREPISDEALAEAASILEDEWDFDAIQREFERRRWPDSGKAFRVALEAFPVLLARLRHGEQVAAQLAATIGEVEEERDALREALREARWCVQLVEKEHDLDQDRDMLKRIDTLLGD